METQPDHHPLPLDDEETVDAVPVVDEVRALERTRAQLPAVKTAAAVAATGFVAGAATVVAISHRARKRGGGRLAGRRRRGVDALPIVSTRSVLLDIHLLGRD
ncbi:hypothetical protein VSS74_26410 [Conexibacter stalactiti]|uniref:Uncharacterized protein n=1 Tax=Conexibacter stalactiti TaxID=1940611 RepID=A0ABU4HXG5_9ACTN|nr:hypothetical protein [Conexibacter stalactiti]MDW5597915.1 hypothetical protein [Conexibacter stalactiti]MEC5038557.1 hypothetical protein [Conexibacter stalactiti]